MIAILKEQRPAAIRSSVKPALPREHGAWGILLIPLATAAGAARAFDLKILLLLAGVLCFYVARTSWLKKHWQWTWILLAGSAICTLPLLVIWHRWWLALFGAIAAPLAFRKTERGVAMQLLAVAGLTLTAPAAWYTATGRLGPEAGLLWLLNLLYFAGGVFYVKMHVAAAVQRKPLGQWRDRLKIGSATLVYYAALTAALSVLAVERSIPWLVLLAYAPVIARAVVGVNRLSATLRIRRLGWTEVAYSVWFAAALIGTLKFPLFSP